jgi:hypothetical protein
MPLMKKASKKAFQHNVKAEMEAHPDKRKQDLAIAYSVQRKAKKKMAEGGAVSAKTESRPMPDQTTNSAAMKSRNSGDKPASHDSWTDNSTVTQAQSNNGRKVMPIARPRMVPSDAFSTRMYDKEGMLQESASPGPYGEQPSRDMDEDGPNRQGPEVPDMADEHSNHRKPYAQGGLAKAEYNDPEDDDQPSEDEGMHMAESRNEEMAMAEGKGPDMEREHSNGRMPYADGGEAEMEEDHHDSITAAIMARRERLHAEIDSGAHDMDSAVMAAEGGILSHDSIYSDDSDQADLSRNHDEDANEEDQLSFNALRKENYNDSNLDVDGNVDGNQIGDDREDSEENKHDMISSIRSKMKTRKQFRG